MKNDQEQGTELQLPRREFLARSFAAVAGVLASSATLAAPKNGILFDPSFVHPGNVVGGQILRRIYLVREPTKEKADFLLWRADGSIDPEGYERFCWFLRDVRRNRVAQMDVRLAAQLTSIQSHFWFNGGARGYYHITSGYRSWETNDRTEGANADSGHVYGGAADGWMEGVSLDEHAAVAHSYKAGGVGIYKKRGFIHTDVFGKTVIWKA